MFIWGWLAQEVVELPGPPPRDAGQMADALLASMAGPAQQAEEAAPEAAQAIQRPMDLFKSIFEASDSSDSSEEDEPEPAPAPAMAAAMEGPQPAPRPQAVQASAAAAPLAGLSSFQREATGSIQPGRPGSALGPQQEEGPAEASAKPVHVFQSRQQRQVQAAAAQLQALDASLPRIAVPLQPSGTVAVEVPGAYRLEGVPGNGVDSLRDPDRVSDGGSNSSESENRDEGVRNKAVGRESRQAGKVSKRKGKHKGKSSKKSKQKEGKHQAKRKHKHDK